MFSNIKIYLWIGLVIALIGSGSYVYNLWNNYKALKFEHQMTLQNEKALSDSLTVVFGQKTILASKVEDLSKANDELKSKNIALEITTKILIDSLKNSGKADSTVLTDSTAKVTFSGKQYFTNFSGFTIANLRNPKLSTWSLSLAFDMIDVRAYLYKAEDGYWKLATISLTPGITVRGESTLDDNTYAALQKYSPPVPPKNFGLNLQATSLDAWGGIIFRYDNRWYINADYKFLNNLPKWSDNLLLGVSYFTF